MYNNSDSNIRIQERKASTHPDYSMKGDMPHHEWRTKHQGTKAPVKRCSSTLSRTMRT